MIRATVGILAGVGGGFDSDYQAVLDYATTQAYTLPSASQQALQNQLVVDLKTAGVWNKLDKLNIYYTDGDSDYACINWKNPGTFDSTKVNTPTFVVNKGFTSGVDGTFIRTNFTPSSDAVQMQDNNASFGGFFTENISSGNGLEIVSGTSANNRNFIRVSNNGTAQGAIHANNQTTTFSNPIASASGFMHIDKSSTTTANYNKNGVSQVSFAPQSGIGLSSVEFTELALSTGGSSSDQFIAVSFYAASLQSEVYDFYTAINSYITSI